MYHELLPVIYKTDIFGKWNIDPLFGHLKIILMMHNKSEFPNKWVLDTVSELFLFQKNFYK